MYDVVEGDVSLSGVVLGVVVGVVLVVTRGV